MLIALYSEAKSSSRFLLTLHKAGNVDRNIIPLLKHSSNSLYDVVQHFEVYFIGVFGHLIGTVHLVTIFPASKY